MDGPELGFSAALPVRHHYQQEPECRAFPRLLDHTQIRWEAAQICSRTLRAETAVRLALASRNLEGYEHLVQWAIEMAATYRASWKVSAQRAINELPKSEI